MLKSQLHLEWRFIHLGEKSSSVQDSPGLQLYFNTLSLNRGGEYVGACCMTIRTFVMEAFPASQSQLFPFTLS
jgi:hypothetical protein